MIYTSAPIRLNKSVDGQTPYIHIKYSDDGGLTFTPYEGETPGKYMGLYADYTKADPTDVSKYKWSLIQGKDGAPGSPGKDGTSVTILGSYDSEAELNAAHPTGELGDSYIVNGDLYVWDGSAWKNAGTIQGPAGEDGVGVSSITAQFYLSTSKTAPTGGAWVETMPTWSKGKYLWTRSKITYTDGTIAYTTPLCDSSWEAVDELDKELDMEEVLYRLTGGYTEEGLYIKDGHLLINGSFIKTGEILTDLIKAGVIKSKDGTLQFDLDNALLKAVDNNCRVQFSPLGILIDTPDNNRWFGAQYSPLTKVFGLHLGNGAGGENPLDLQVWEGDTYATLFLPDAAGNKVFREICWKTIAGVPMITTPGAGLSLTAKDVGAVPLSRTINGISLLGDIVLFPESIGALPATLNTAWGCYYNTVSGETEWINPPMSVGTEYRTTERFNGKVVYAKAVNLGTLPGKNGEIHVSHGASITNMLRCTGTTSNGGMIPYTYNNGATFLINISASSTSINVWTADNDHADYSDTTGTATIWYTKD